MLTSKDIFHQQLFENSESFRQSQCFEQRRHTNDTKQNKGETKAKQNQITTQ